MGALDAGRPWSVDPDARGEEGDPEVRRSVFRFRGAGPLWLLLPLLAVSGCPAPAPDAGPPRVSGDPWLAHEGRLYDDRDREVLLRGLNARVEGLFDVTFDDGRTPLEPIPPFGADDCLFLARDLGMNHLRLPVNWSGIEPVRGAYDADYVDRIIEVVDDCAAYGVWTVVDLHQDAWSKHIGEDGAPLWAIVPPPQELLEGPLHDLDARRVSEQVLAAFESFWLDRDDLQTAYAEMAAHLAARLDGHPGVVGIELMNEPVLTGAADRRHLAAFHEGTARAIREAVPGMTVLFEPDATRNFTDRTLVKHPFPLADAVYSPHIYTQVFTSGWASRDQVALTGSVHAAREEAAAHGAALYVGEYGNDPTTETGRLFVRTALDAYDAVLASSAFWVYEEWSQGSWGLYDAGGTEAAPARGRLRGPIADILARPYPQAVDGRLAGVEWSAPTSTLTVEIREAGAGEHLLSAPTRIYPEGVHVSCDGDTVEARPGPFPGRVAVRCSGRRLVMRPA